MGRFRKVWMSEGRRAQIILLDGRKLDIIVQPRLYVEELFNIVASHCDLKDPDKQYFGLVFIDEFDQYHWLPRDRRVLDFELPRKYTALSTTLILHHTVKFFVASCSSLAHPSTVELYYSEAKSQLAKGALDLSDIDFYRIGSYLLQICGGDFKDDDSARSLLRQVLPLPKRILVSYCISHIECEDSVIELYKDLTGMSRGSAILSFMKIAERSETYGSQFYQVRDKSGEAWTVGINSRGIFQFDVNDRSKPKKVFQWKHLENLYYRDRKFSIEVHDARRVVQSLSSCNMYEDLVSSASRMDGDDDLAQAVCDPTTQVSVSRRAFAPSSVYVHAFFCETAFMCRTLWSTAIAQHQFYLDQRTAAAGAAKKLSNAGRVGAVNLDELAEKLTRLASSSSVGSTTSSLLSTPTNMAASARTRDGSAASIPSLHSTMNQKSDEDRQRDLENYRLLKTKKLALEEELTRKLRELREICINEGEITGELPKEIYRSLAPGEPEPKIKRRVGTAFSLSSDLLCKQSKADIIDQLEGDIELHRKIVLAAHKLASDKSTNKSVRKKRQKDYLAASQTLKALEQRLLQQRLRASQPDISNVHNQNSRAWPNFSGRPMASPQLSRGGTGGGGLLVAKSCPTTPRGSVPDLSLETGDTEDEEDHPPRPPSANSARHFAVNRSPQHPHGLPPHPPGRRPTLPMSKLVASLQQGINSPEDKPGVNESRALDNPLRPAGSSPSLPIYENIGYKSSSAYKSSYRQLNFPTLIAGQNNQPNGRVHRTHSEHSLQSLPSNVAIAPPQPLPDFRTAGSDAIEHDVGAYNVPRQRTSWNYRSIDQGLNKPPDTVDDRDQEQQTSPLAAAPSAYAIGRVKGLVRKMSATAGNRQSSSPASSATFCTNSLDRRALRNRQRSTGQLAQGSPTSGGVGGETTPTTPTSGRFPASPAPSPKRDYATAIANGLNAPRTTTFPVTAHGGSVETSKPFETADIARYSSSNITTRPRSPLVLNGKATTPTSANGQPRPPPPPYSNSNSTRNPSTPTDPHMEALLDFYKENERRKPKTATIV